MADDARQALSLDSILANGLTVAGQSVVRAILVMEDGRRAAFDLPVQSAGKQQKRWADTDAGRAILDALANAATPQKGATVAKLAGYAYAGRFRETLAGLVEDGDVSHNGDGYSVEP